MTLVDTSVWVEHLRQGNARLARLLEGGDVVAHPYVVGELALGDLPRREVVLADLLNLPAAAVATPAEVLAFTQRQRLYGRGIGFVNAALMASAALTPGTALWTHDRRLRAVAAELGLAAA